MNIISSLETAERIVDTMSRISMYNWNKRNLLTLIITTVIFTIVTVVIYIIKSKQKGVEDIAN